MTEGFAARGYLIDVVVPNPPPGQSTTWENRDAWPDWLRIHPVTYMRPKPLQQLFFTAGTPENLSRAPWKHMLVLPAALCLWNTVESLAPNWSAVVSHWLLPSALIAPRVPHIHLPHLAIAHSGDVHLLKQIPGRSVVAAAIARRSSAVGFISNQLRTEFAAMLPSSHPYVHKLHVTPMGISQMSTAATPKETQRSGSEVSPPTFTVLYVGRLTAIKGVLKLIEAAHDDSFRLVIAGEGEQESALRQACVQHGANAIFYGRVSPEERNALMQTADVLVVPSVELPNGRHEGIPMVIPEAMAAGLPVVASRTGGIEELIVDRENGLLVPPGDSESLRRAIAELRNSTSLSQRLRTWASQTATERLWSKLIPRYEQLLFNR
ncbi:MAG: glycosyltransferase family 4 protein [Deltaproteobacteria bacterium]|nr:glycosyltransferase family 4 protein [Deltaproteobacteria bacterium]MBN2671763.1 glycosyltransferase family 4 protein [Deltaproteobacteria bacterium]